MPLRGKRVVVTRRPEQAGEFIGLLAAEGAVPLAFPAIQLAPLPSTALDQALRRLSDYDWLLFTSSNGVEFFFQRLHELQLQPVWPAIGVSGRTTAAKLSSFGLQPTFVPKVFVGEALVAGLGTLNQKRILLPRAKQGRVEIAQQLRQQGAIVDDIPLYDTVPAVPTQQALAAIASGTDVVTFGSPTSVRFFLKILRDVQQETWLHHLQTEQILIATIGPITTSEVEEQGLAMHIQPSEYTVVGLIEALVKYYNTEES